ncbi:class I SAM-dependent methyltransferase [Nocardia higoensis]|uniref:Class I SAM-dependent methyltransferase n=1 Tax=Nocardia higoensis TaxID=228599 RepID=A0ABS0D6L9_9NOCA|nr:class I SAM-dependent methyltransferase [Nocardia higoensis]MBF6354128.1 class I SAM-dependent methyltransferase [Nocardia higoensis]
MPTAEHRDKARRARSFGAAAQEYEHGRPSYPPESVSWLVPEDARTVVDIGAGTGKLTRTLLSPGREVIAVEPSAEMRDQFARVLPDVRMLAATAESIPLHESSADVMVCAQAWHWVSPERATPEAARVLRPGGRLSLAWNTRDVSEPWVAELDRILSDRAASARAGVRVPQLQHPFGPLERQEFRWTHPTSPEEIISMVASRSYVITMAPIARQELLDSVWALVEAEAPTGMPYVTECYRAAVETP